MRHQKGNKMTTQGKELVKKEVKKIGSHIGTVKKAIEENGLDFNIYSEFIKECFSKKYNSVKYSIKKSIRYQ